MAIPLYQAEAEFFKTLGHPARIRILELLSERDHAVHELLERIAIEPSNLSQQLAVLRRTSMVVSHRRGGEGAALARTVRLLAALLRSTRGDAVVLTITAAATIAFDLVTAVLLGLVVAGFFALQQAARSARLEEMPLDEADHGDEERSLLDEHIVAYRLDGPLFFAAAHDFLLELTDVTRVRVVILRLSRVTAIDATGAHVLADTISRLEHRHVTVLLSGIQAHHEQVLRELGVHSRLAHERHLFATTPEAIAHARVHAARVAHEPAGGAADPGEAVSSPPSRGQSRPETARTPACGTTVAAG